MTAAEKRLYHYKWDRFQKRQERIFTVKFRKALKEQARQQATLGYISSAPIYEVLVDLYKTVGTLWANETRLQVKRQQVKARMPMGFSQRIVDLMRQYYGIDLLNDAELMTVYSREVIVNVLSDAALSGASINEIVRTLEKSPGFDQMRARRIARTETVTAANGAAVIHAKESGFAKNKIWLSVNDKRTRHSHRMIDDAKVLIDEPFNVNGTQMMQPGVRKQPNGLAVPASEVVNCRCTVAFEVIE
jgi:SPP1 gp7 family putative phage head morphogenesis protein